MIEKLGKPPGNLTRNPCLRHGFGSCQRMTSQGSALGSGMQNRTAFLRSSAGQIQAHQGAGTRSGKLSGQALLGFGRVYVLDQGRKLFQLLV